MRRIAILIISLLAGLPLYAISDSTVDLPSPNEVTIGAADVSRAGAVLTVSYEIRFGKNVNWCRTKLMVSTDGGYSFRPVMTPRMVSGDVGKLTSDGRKSITYDVTEDKAQLAGKPVVFKVEVTGKDVLKQNILVQAEFGVAPQVSFGAMFGMVKKIGWYVKAKSDFHFPSVAYQCNSAGEIEGGGAFWAGGESQKTRLSLTGGALFRGTGWLFPYAGLGYGSRSVCWQDYRGDWAKVSDQSCAGIALDAGVVFKFGKFAVSAGISNTMFKYTEVEVGVGVML